MHEVYYTDLTNIYQQLQSYFPTLFLTLIYAVICCTSCRESFNYNLSQMGDRLVRCLNSVEVVDGIYGLLL